MGALDPNFFNTQNFANYIKSIGVDADIHVAEDALGGHNEGYWKYHLKDYVTWYGQYFSQSFK